MKSEGDILTKSAISLTERKHRIHKYKMVLRKLKQTGISLSLGGGVILLLLMIWEIFSISGWVKPQFSSSPTRVLNKGLEMAASGELWKHTIASGQIFIIGYGLAVLVGVPIGILLGWYKRLNQAFGPVVAAMYTTPRIALMPLFIIWFGLGSSSKIVLVFLSAIFPIIVNMVMGMRSIDGDLTKVAKSYSASQRQIFWTIALPMSVPFLMTALQLATGRALIGVIGAEIFGSKAGLGYMIMYAGATFQTDIVFLGVFIIAAFGIAMDRFWFYLSQRFDAWRGND
ncbi:ABC transporter permease [Paenibacillus naphthalenovorans]|uniref:ABC transporter permease n=1 Tax=Paenibacillus naphthalenovorans TaxID=162209 RepID=UPI0007842889|nr:ABC transporter permease [Paenibacillus naphthalenovorans]GCL71838.1 ABC transporter permease [Paenibacillus naphthalenovorans]